MFTRDVSQGVFVTQKNLDLRNGVSLAANMQISTLSNVFASGLLTSPNLSRLVALNSTRLTRSYEVLTSFFKAKSIRYIPSNAGVYVFANLEIEGKETLIRGFKEAGVSVSPGSAYHLSETEIGWARITFAVEETQLREAIRRMSGVVDSKRRLLS